MRVLGSPSYGDHSGKARAGIWRQSDHYRAERGIPRRPDRRDSGHLGEPREFATGRKGGGYYGAGREGSDRMSVGVHRECAEALP